MFVEVKRKANLIHDPGVILLFSVCLAWGDVQKTKLKGISQHAPFSAGGLGHLAY